MSNEKEPQGTLVAGRYRLDAVLGSGGSGTVYRVHDVVDDRPMAMKILKGERGQLLASLRDEFALLTRMRHPGVVAVHDLGSCPERGPFYTMELVAGASLADSLGDLPAARRDAMADAMVRQLLEALAHVHGVGIVHADIKPDNVLLAQDAFKLGDFGLASTEHAGGTIAYMAPEVLAGEPPSHRSDLYSLGLTVLALLRGAPLFGRAEERLRALGSGSLAAAEADTRGLGTSMRRLLRGLLHEDPGHRYRSAAEALADYLGEEPPGLAHGAHTTSFSLPFAGRETTISELEDQVERALRADAGPRLVLISGPAGIGMTRLLRELSWRLQVKSRRVAMASLARPDVVGQWRRALSPMTGEEAWSRAAMLLDDAHGTLDGKDLDQLRLFLARVAFLPSIVVVAGQRAGLMADLVSTWSDEPHVRHCRLEPLSAETVAELVARVLGAAAEANALGRLISEATGGVPRLVEAALKGLEERNLILRQGGRWLVTPLTVNASAYQDGLEDAVARAQIGSRGAEESLPDAARELLGGLALASPWTLSIGLLEHLGRPGSAAAVLAALQDLHDRGMVYRTMDDGGTLSYAARPDVSLATVRGMERSRARRQSATLHDALDAHADPLLRYELLGKAGRRRAQEKALDGAVELLLARRQTLRAARELARFATLSSEQGRDRQRRAARLFRLAGQPARSVVLLERALARGEDVLARHELAEALEALGRYDDSAAMLQQLVEQGAPLVQARALESLLWLRTMQGRYEEARGLGERALGLVRDLDSGLDASLRYKLGTIAQLRGEHEAAIASFEIARARQQELGNLKAAAAAENGLGSSLRAMGRLPEALEHLQRAVSLFESLGELPALTRAEANLGNVHYELGDWRAAEERWRRSSLVALQAGDRSQMAINHSNLADMLKDQGRLDAAEHVVKRAQRLARKLPRLRPLIVVNAGEVRARQGRVREAARLYRHAHALARGRPELLPSIALRLGELALQEGKARRARRWVTLALRQLRVRGATPEVAMCLRLQGALHRIEGRPHAALELLSAAVAEVSEEGSPMILARLRAEMALCHRDVGERSRAEEQEKEALAIFERLGAAPEMERLRVAMGGSSTPELPSGADLSVLLEVTRAVSSELSIDRLLATIVDKAIEISDADRGFLVLEGVGERPYRYRSGRDAQGRTIPEGEFDVSGTVIRDVVRGGQAVALVEGEDGSPLLGTESVHRLGLRTVLCAPIRTRERAVIGAIYVDSSRSHRAFDGRVTSLMEALATQAGIAIVNAELYDDQKRRNELIAIVSHELRGPLTSIRCYVELLRMESPKLDRKKKERFLELMDEECTRLSRLVENILDVARLESGKENWSVGVVAMEELLPHACEAVRAEAQAKNIELAVEVAADLPPVLGNFDRLMQVALNLVGNAVKYTPAGGHVRVSAGPRKVRGIHLDFVEVRVEDDGVGIDPAELDRIFVKFGRVGRGGRLTPTGTGLGLPIAKEIVESHGGRIWVESRPGSGSTFAFHLPIRGERAIETSVPDQVREASSPPGGQARRATGL